MSGRHRSRRSRHLVMIGALALAATSAAVPGAFGGYVAKVGNTNDTAATNPYFTCAAASSGEANVTTNFAYPLSEATGTAATDISGNARTGLYNNTGVNYAVANTAPGAVCGRDKRTVVTLNGTTGAISGPNILQTNPNTFTVEIWFRTGFAQGKLIGFGNARTGSSSANNYDRHLYIDDGGLLRFGVYPAATRVTIASGASVVTSTWHYAAASLSSSGMALYLDGQLVNSSTAATTGRNYSGYWRIGYDDLTLWPNNAPEHFRGQLAFAAVYDQALTAGQVKAHYAAGV